MTPSDFAVNWLLNNQLVTSVIGGPRTLAQWKASVNAIKHDFNAEDEAIVNSLVSAGHPATPGHTWGRYPVQGWRAINS